MKETAESASSWQNNSMSCEGRPPAYEVVFGAVARGRPLRSVVLPECSGLFEDAYHVVEVLAGDLVRQVVVAGPISGTQAYIA
jgi:hypothetical protein